MDINKGKEKFLKYIRENYYPDLDRKEFEDGFRFESEMVSKCDSYAPYGGRRVIETYYSFTYGNNIISYTDEKYSS